jgi:uncharacterized protein DUF4007
VIGRGVLFSDDYRPQFSGHETFPLRYGWLKKAYDAVAATETDSTDEERAPNRRLFLDEDAIARFGVGKNMVGSMRHWAAATHVVEERPSAGIITITDFGRAVFRDGGLDPYIEHHATLWLLHWHLAARPAKTTWFWAFNYYPSVSFEREQLIRGLERIARERGWSRVAGSTVKNDVACFIRTYVAQHARGVAAQEDALESPLTELGLIRPVGKRDGFRFDRGPKPTLPSGVFAYALVDFWDRFHTAATLSCEAIMHEPGSPGRVFLLEENDVIDRLGELEDLTGGRLQFSETAGLKQVARHDKFTRQAAFALVKADYAPRRQKRAAA